jgi:hypothetical protein
MPKCPERSAWLSREQSSQVQWVVGAGARRLDAVVSTSSDIAFSQDLNDAAGSYQAGGSGSLEVLIPPARLALLNILWRIPLSIFTAYGLTA